MRIISETHDYYDSFMAMDQDRDTLYIRKQTSKLVKRGTPESKMMPEWPNCPGSYYCHRSDWPHTISGIHYSMVGFCKKIYPVVKIWHRPEPGASAEKHTICFTMEDVDAFFSEHFSEEELKEWEANKYYRRSLPWSCRRKSWVEFFDECKKIEDKHEDLFDKLQTPIFEYNFRYRDWTIIVNPVLKHLEFYRKFPGYEAYQELVMYFGNLANPERPIPVIDDVTLAEAKGFNKFSFRKDKSK